MLSEEEKKAIKYFYNLRATIDESYMLFAEEINVKCGKDMIKQITLVLNLITKLQKENEEKDKQIDLMVEKIYKRISAKELDKYCNKQKNNCKNYEDCFKCIKQYFETKAKKGE